MKKAAPIRGAAGSADDDKKAHPSDSTSPHVLQVTDRNLMLGYLRAIWWSQRRQGHCLPAERGVIVIEGGRR